MKVLLIYPRYPDTFWSFRYALKFVNKKATHPPLGLLTVASLLPVDWEKKLVDLNIEPLNLEMIKWADLIMISAMSVQRDSAEKIINLAKTFNKKIVAGGPLFTSFWQDFLEKVDHLVLNEAEITLPEFLNDLKRGTPKKIYTTKDFADLKTSPIPAYHLVNLKAYTSMCIQYSRGCPFNCEFCDVTNLFGKKIRTKTSQQILKELENLYTLGWRGSIFFVDDNFIGNKWKVKNELLPTLIEWQKKHNYPFYFYTQVSINLADDEELILSMTEAGFNSVFIGIETPHEQSLKEVDKKQNVRRNLIEDVKKLQHLGLEVMGGFIVGFDNDPPNISDLIINFVKESKIVIAMVGLLNAPPGTRLYKRLEKEGRIKPYFKGDNTDFTTNILPKMGYQNLIKHYSRIIKELYQTKNYYKRIKDFLEDFTPSFKFKLDKQYLKINFGYIRGLPKIFLTFGVFFSGRIEFWKILFYTLLKKPQAFFTVIAQILSGHHFKKIFKNLFY